MKSSNTEQDNTLYAWIIWFLTTPELLLSWIFSFFMTQPSNQLSRVFPLKQQPSSSILSLIMEHKNANFILMLIIEFLRPIDLHNFVNTKNLRLFQTLNSENALFFQLRKEFHRLIAIEPYENYEKAESLLNAYPKLASQLISSQVIGFKDVAGRFFESALSAYGYAYWQQDTEMCLMLQKYMDKSSKLVVFNELKNIQEKGLTYQVGNTHKRKTITHSKQFDLHGVILKYEIHKKLIQTIAPHDNRDQSWKDADQHWVKNIANGEDEPDTAQKFWPLRLRQEFCSILRLFLFDELYKPYERLLELVTDNLIFDRNDTVYNCSMSPYRLESWSSVFKSENLAIYKGIAAHALRLPSANCDYKERRYSRIFQDLNALKTFCKARTEIDLQYTFDNLVLDINTQKPNFLL